MHFAQGAVRAGNFQAGVGGLFLGVGGEDGQGDLLEVVELRAQIGGQAGQGGDELPGWQRNTDDAG